MKTNFVLMGIAILSAPVLRAGDSVPGGGRTAAEIVTEAPVSLVGKSDTLAFREERMPGCPVSLVGENGSLAFREERMSGCPVSLVGKSDSPAFREERMPGCPVPLVGEGDSPAFREERIPGCPVPLVEEIDSPAFREERMSGCPVSHVGKNNSPAVGENDSLAFREERMPGCPVSLVGENDSPAFREGRMPGCPVSLVGKSDSLDFREERMPGCPVSLVGKSDSPAVGKSDTLAFREERMPGCPVSLVGKSDSPAFREERMPGCPVSLVGKIDYPAFREGRMSGCPVSLVRKIDSPAVGKNGSPAFREERMPGCPVPLVGENDSLAVGENDSPAFWEERMPGCPVSLVGKIDSPAVGDSDTLTLRDVIVSSTFSNVSRSPLRLTTIDSETLRERAAARTYPELLKGIPSLYATSESGSYGDAKLNIRGFGQENISVLLNGIPISGLVTGSMYWNNWMGLADATYAVQVQKGVGASLLSDGSVGGSVNILTDSPSETFTAEAGFYGSDYGTMKGYVKVASGALPKGWSMNMMLSHVRGSGYVDATSVNSYAYMLSVSKRFGEEHSVIFTALGSPEKHEQRSSRLSFAEVSEYGLSYNKNWGYRDGKVFNLSLNNYFKPYFTLQHIWSGEKVSMKNSVYVAFASGGGRWSETKGKPLSSYTADGLIDWTSAIAANRNPDGSAANILSQYTAGHTHAGVISTLEYALGRGFKVGAGLHGQIYNTWEEETIDDLLGADFWIEDYEGKSLAGLAGRNPVKHVGDKVRTENGKNTSHGTAYLSLSYESERLSFDLGASLFGSRTRRWDLYNYVGDDVWSDAATGTGASIKGGALFKAGNGHSVYASAGWYSRLPYSSVWFSSGNNEITRDVTNERNMLGEIGWRHSWVSGNFELTGYSAYWKNKTLMSSKYKQIDSEDSRYMVTGLDALHLGVEFSLFQRLGRWLEAEAFASVGDWKWKNDVNAIIYDDYSGVAVGKVDVYCDGLPVGDAPQTQIGANLKALLPKGFAVRASWQFNDRMYADFDPLTRTDPEDRTPSYRLPSYHLLGADASWTGNFGKFSLTVFVQGNNLLGTSFIERGKDGSSHDSDTFTGFWGFGRNADFGARISF